MIKSSCHILEHYNQPTLNIDILVSNLTRYRNKPLQIGAKINRCTSLSHRGHMKGFKQVTDSMVQFKASSFYLAKIVNLNLLKKLITPT